MFKNYSFNFKTNETKQLLLYLHVDLESVDLVCQRKLIPLHCLTGSFYTLQLPLKVLNGLREVIQKKL